MRNRINCWILRLTRRRWNVLIARVLCQAKQAGLINSQTLHILAKEFDPTQGGIVGQLPKDPQVTEFLRRQYAVPVLKGSEPIAGVVTTGS